MLSVPLWAKEREQVCDKEWALWSPEVVKKVSPSLNMKSDYSKKERQILDPNQNTTCVSLSAVFQSVVLLPLLRISWQQRVTWKKNIWRIYLWNSYMNLLRKAESRPVVIKSIALWYCITAKVILFCSSAKWKFLLQLIGGHRFCGITNSSGLLKTKAWSHISSICINTEFF